MSTAALSLVLVSALLHAIWTASIKESREPLGFNLLQTLPFVPLALAIAAAVDLTAVPPRAWACLIASCGIHAAYVFWMARALERTELSVAYPIMRSAPAFLPLLAVPLLGESVSARGAAGIAIVVAGMWLVNTGGRTSLSRLFAAGTGFAYLTLFATVAYSLSDKAGMASLSAADWASPVPRSLVYFVLLGVGHGALVAPFVLHRVGGRALRAQARTEWRRILFAALLTTGSYTLILEALRHAPVSYVAAARQSSVLFALLLGALWFHETAGPARMAGALLTVAGVVLVALA